MGAELYKFIMKRAAIILVANDFKCLTSEFVKQPVSVFL